MTEKKTSGEKKHDYNLREIRVMAFLSLFQKQKIGLLQCFQLTEFAMLTQRKGCTGVKRHSPRHPHRFGMKEER